MKTFEELGVCSEVCRAIEELGFVQPMPVQEEVIPRLIESQQDMIALAQTGTGKTAAFGLPLLRRMRGCWAQQETAGGQWPPCSFYQSYSSIPNFTFSTSHENILISSVTAIPSSARSRSARRMSRSLR